MSVPLKKNARNYLKKVKSATVGEIASFFKKGSEQVILVLDELIEEGCVDYQFDKRETDRSVENRFYFYIDLE